MNNFKKFFAPLLLTLLTVTSCGGEPAHSEDEGTTTVTFFGWGSAEEQENFQILVDKFMELNEDVRVVYTATSSDTYMNTLRNRANNLPDVFYVPDYEFMQWADSGRLLPLDDLVPQEEINQLWPLSTSMYRYNRDTFTLGEGPLYALPKDLGPFALVYNKDLLLEIIESKGLTLELPDPNIPMTWDEFIDYLTQLKYTDGPQKIYGVTHYELATAVYSNNADFFYDNVSKEGISTDNFIEAVQFIADLNLVHDVMPSADEQSSLNGFQRFLNRGSVFTFMGPWDLKSFWNSISFEFDLMPTPVGRAAGSKSTSWVGSVGYAINAKTRRKDAAIRLARFLACSEESNVLNYQIGQAMPNIISIAENQFLNNEGLSGRNLLPENKNVWVDIVKGTQYVGGKNRPNYYPYDNTFYNDLVDALAPIWEGSSSARDVLTSYAAKYQRGMDDSLAYLS